MVGEWRRARYSIRCSICADTFSACMIRQHNDAGVLSFGAHVTGEGRKAAATSQSGSTRKPIWVWGMSRLRAFQTLADLIWDASPLFGGQNAALKPENTTPPSTEISLRETRGSSGGAA